MVSSVERLHGYWIRYLELHHSMLESAPESARHHMRAGKATPMAGVDPDWLQRRPRKPTSDASLPSRPRRQVANVYTVVRTNCCSILSLCDVLASVAGYNDSAFKVFETLAAARHAYGTGSLLPDANG